jgi:hypothetical protein
MSGDPHDVATSPERDAFTNAANTMPLDPEHPLSGYNDEDNTYVDVPNPFANHERDPYEVPGPHNGATSLERRAAQHRHPKGSSPGTLL